SDYEKQRLLNMERNKALLREMAFFLNQKKSKGRRATSKKRPSVEEHENAPSPKASRTQSVKSRNSEVGEASAVRRSSRNAGKTVDYKAEHQRGSPLPVSFTSGVRSTENTGPLGREAGSKRLHDPKFFGSIPGVEVGTWWESREACSTDSVHAPWVAGIAPGPQGAYSVALSVVIPTTLTGAMRCGRNLKGTKANPMNLRTAPQSSDQTFDNNVSTASSERKKPVRVIRGFKLDSPYAPYEGRKGLARERDGGLSQTPWSAPSASPSR
ncbi:PUA-like domain-containing protein, partial [Mycena olivaceomarginata]